MIFFNVAVFEELIASASDCLVLFPESPGSFAEAGFFSKSKEIRKKVLLVNNVRLQSTDSFMNIGPVDLFNADSKFKPALQINYSSSKPSIFADVKKRIAARIPAKNRESFQFSEDGGLIFTHKIYLIYDLVSLFRAITKEGVEFVLSKCFPQTAFPELNQLLSILIAAD